MPDERANPKSPGSFQPSPPARPGLHLKYVDGFRGLAALYVVLDHAWLQTVTVSPAGPLPQWAQLAEMLLDYGKFAVTFFIAISGFCLMLPVVRNEGSLGAGGGKRFFVRRARRILPPYYATLVLSIMLVVGFITNRSHNPYEVALPTTAAGILSHIFLVHNLHALTITQINPPLWSIAVECQIYLLFPFLIEVRRRYGMLVVLAGTYVAAFTLESMIEGTPYVGLLPLFLFVFALGMFAAEEALGPRKKIYIWLGCAMTGVMAVMLLTPRLRDLALVEAVVGIVAMCGLIVCGQWPGNPLARVATWPPIAGIGIFSYSLYLIHFPLQEVLWQHLILPLGLGRGAGFALIGGVGTALILLLAYGFYWVFERPFCNQASRVNAEQALPSARFAQ
jgi:peptidoglycan/LPS O-acetylase OafA/YrhL